MQEDYSNVFVANVEPKLVFKAITEQIDLWWTTATNEAKEIDDKLRVEFGGDTFKVMRITNAYPGKSLTWEVTEAHIGHEELIKKDEWVGTKIHWFIRSEKNGSQVEFVHQGLTSQMECWGVCSKGWDYFLGSLKAFLNSGKGSPMKPELLQLKA